MKKKEKKAYLKDLRNRQQALKSFLNNFASSFVNSSESKLIPAPSKIGNSH